jgi:hypothetical protein
MTPSEWLLEQFDADHTLPFFRTTNHVRELAEILDDHSGDCNGEAFCWKWSGAARWPDPFIHQDLDDDA